MQKSEQMDICMSGSDSMLLSDSERAAGVLAALNVFQRHGVDVSRCAMAEEKRAADGLLTADEALWCIIWDDAQTAAWRAATIGWLSRDVDIGIALALTAS